MSRSTTPSASESQPDSPVSPENKTQNTSHPAHPRTTINGHDYSASVFIEISTNYSETVLSTLPQISSGDLYLFCRRSKEARRFRGFGWRDIFMERTACDKNDWLTVKHLRELAAKFKTYGYYESSYRYRVWYLEPGVVHLELDDDGEWSVRDILSLPLWMLVG